LSAYEQGIVADDVLAKTDLTAYGIIEAIDINAAVCACLRSHRPPRCPAGGRASRRLAGPFNLKAAKATINLHSILLPGIDAFSTASVDLAGWHQQRSACLNQA